MQWTITWYDGETRTADKACWRGCPAGLGWAREQLENDLQNWLLLTMPDAEFDAMAEALCVEVA